MQPSKFRLILLLVSLSLFLLTSKNSLAQSYSSGDTVDSPDAIAVRIVPNPNHYNISRWYANQGFHGSPQALMVDGYEAIRDGRTVYVNATNVDLTTSPKNIYTNVYLISYNQNPTPNTVDILGQIISHWKFNNNIIDTPITSAHTLPPNCSISTLNCASDKDCSIDQKCETSGSASSTCLFKTPKSCSIDAECPTSFFCDSTKAQIIRDVKRVGQLQELRLALANFKEANNSYPLLSAGSYLPSNSVSLWPSWSQVLLTDLAVSPDLVDPINHLGACPGYDQNTCWSQETKKFVSAPTSHPLTLPSSSYAFAYQVNSNGSAYNLCTTMESQVLGYQFSPNNLINSVCSTAIGTGGQTTTTPPKLIDVMLTGEAYQPFNGFIKVASPRPLTWLLTSNGGSIWSGWHNGPTPVLQNTSNPNQKKVYAPFAGITGEYPLIITVTDDRGESLTTSTKIVISSSPITITAENGEYISGSTNFNYGFTFSGNGFTSNPVYHSTHPNSYSVTKTSGPADLLNVSTGVITPLGGNEYRVTYSNITSPSVAVATTYGYQIKTIDSNGSSATKNFSLKIVPSNLFLNLNFSCDPTVRFKQSYSCLLGPTANSYTVIGQPTGLQINGSNFSGSPTVTGYFNPITITATNVYNVSTSSNFSLQVNTYCGDGIKQTPNTEGAGGPGNNGQEECDGTSGITADPLLSSINLQYGCTTGVGDITPYPITTSDKCSYKAAINFGGYCGDSGLCEYLDANGQPLETCSNCPLDCGACACTPQCTGKVCGAPDGCTTGGTCAGTCPTGETCNANHQCVAEKSGYKDSDKDGYGVGVYGTYASSTSYDVVSNNTDCDDNNTNVYPGQTAYFSSSITGGGPKNGTFDYNCDGAIQFDTSTPYLVTENPNASTCEYDEASGKCTLTTGKPAKWYYGWKNSIPTSCGDQGEYLVLINEGYCRASDDRKNDCKRSPGWEPVKISCH